MCWLTECDFCWHLGSNTIIILGNLGPFCCRKRVGGGAGCRSIPVGNARAGVCSWLAWVAVAVVSENPAVVED